MMTITIIKRVLTIINNDNNKNNHNHTNTDSNDSSNNNNNNSGDDDDDDNQFVKNMGYLRSHPLFLGMFAWRMATSQTETQVSRLPMGRIQPSVSLIDGFF